MSLSVFDFITMSPASLFDFFLLLLLLSQSSLLSPPRSVLSFQFYVSPSLRKGLFFSCTV